MGVYKILTDHKGDQLQTVYTKHTTALIDNSDCIGHEAEVINYVKDLREQWEGILEKINEKTQKLREANQQQQFNEAAKDLDFWLSEVRE